MSGPGIVQDEERVGVKGRARLKRLPGQAGAKSPSVAGIPNSVVNTATNPGGEESDPELLSKIKGRSPGDENKQGAGSQEGGGTQQAALGGSPASKSAPQSIQEQRALKLDTIPIKSEFTKLAKISHTMFGLSRSIKEYNNLVALIADKLPQLNTEIAVMHGAVSTDQADQDPVQRSAGLKAKADVVLDLLEEAGRHPKCSESKREYLWNVYEIIKREAYANLPGSDEEQGGAYHASDSHKTLFPTGEALRQGISQALESVKAKSSAQHNALMGQGSGIVGAIGAKLDAINATLKGVKLPPKSSVTKISEKQAVAKEVAGAITGVLVSTNEIKEALNGYIGSKNVSKNPKVMGALANVVPRCDSGIAALRNIYDVVLRYYHDGTTPFEIDGKTLFSLSTEILTAASAKPNADAKKGKGGHNVVDFADDAKWGKSVIKASGEESTVIRKTKVTAAAEKGKAAKTQDLENKTYGVQGSALNEASQRFAAGDSSIINEKTRSETVDSSTKIDTATKTIKHNLATRDAGVGRISKLLGFDSIINTRITQSEFGDKDITMDEAQGKEAYLTDFYAGRDEDGEIPKEAKVTALLKRVISPTANATPEVFNKERSKNFESKIKKFGSAFHNIYDNDTIVSLIRMKIVDAIANHDDRHRDNFFYDPETKKFVGIDNDLSFTNVRDVMIADAQGHKFSFDNDVPCIDEETKAAVMAVSEDDIYGILLGALPLSFVNAAVVRLKAVKEHISKVEVVENDKIGAVYKEKTEAAMAKRLENKADNKSYDESKQTGITYFDLSTNAAEGLTSVSAFSLFYHNFEMIFSPETYNYFITIGASNNMFAERLLGDCAKMLLEKCGWDLDKALKELEKHDYYIDRAAGYKIPEKKQEADKKAGA